MSLIEKISLALIAREERRIRVTFDYIRHMARTDLRLLLRYNRIFGIIDPRRHLPAEAYHTARIRGALAADCGTCVEAEINLALNAGLPHALVQSILSGACDKPDLSAVIALADAATRDRVDAPEARAHLRSVYGEKGLIELSIAMNGAAMLPGVKRAMGFASACNIDLLRGHISEHAS